jgi:hypothetical protein
VTDGAKLYPLPSGILIFRPDFVTSPQLAASVVAAAVTLGTACGRPASPPPAERVAPSYNTSTGRLEKITYDRNHDGQPDAWAFMDGTRILRAELDEDFDGRLDRWEYYAEGSTSMTTAALARVEQATRQDGKVSRRETYVDGQLATAEEDTDADGRADKWETWEGGTLTSIALDTAGRGVPDRRLVYPADGSEPRLEVDSAGTGRFRSSSSSQ